MWKQAVGFTLPLGKTLFSIGTKLCETLGQVDYLENKTVSGVLHDAIHSPLQGIIYFYNPIEFPCTCVA
jgi:hypothetical protein